MGQMRNFAILVMAAALLVAFSSRVDAGKTCIASATEALPKMTGLVVKRSRTRPVAQAILATWKGQSKPVMIDVDVETEGDAQTFSYMCVITQGSAFVQRTMN